MWTVQVDSVVLYVCVVDANINLIILGYCYSKEIENHCLGHFYLNTSTYILQVILVLRFRRHKSSQRWAILKWFFFQGSVLQKFFLVSLLYLTFFGGNFHFTKDKYCTLTLCSICEHKVLIILRQWFWCDFVISLCDGSDC